MESSIAVFLMRHLAYEQLPTTYSKQVRTDSSQSHTKVGLFNNVAILIFKSTIIMQSLFKNMQQWKKMIRCCLYLLGLLAMIKCSICSYQCDN